MPSPLAIGLLGLLTGAAQGYGERKTRKRQEKKAADETARQTQSEALAREDRRRESYARQGEFTINKSLQEEQLRQGDTQFNTTEARRAKEFATTSAENKRQFNVESAKTDKLNQLQTELTTERNKNELLRLLNQISGSVKGKATKTPEEQQTEFITDALLRQMSAGTIPINNPEKLGQIVTNLRGLARMSGINVQDTVDEGQNANPPGVDINNNIGGVSQPRESAGPELPPGSAFSPYLQQYVFPYNSLTTQPTKPEVIPPEIIDMLRKNRRTIKSDTLRTIR